MFSGFMVHAWIVATLVAIVGGAVGFFIVMRGSAFVAHAIPNGSFAGAAGASLVGVSTLVGLGVFSLGGALGIGLLSRRGRHDVATALSLVFMLGLGALFLSFSVEYAPAVYSLLFGEVLGISDNELWPTIALTAALPVRAGDPVAAVAAGLGAARMALRGSTRSSSRSPSSCWSRWRRR